GIRLVAFAICGTALVLLAAIRVSSATQDQGNQGDQGEQGDQGGESYTIGLFGDMPYNALGRAQYPNLLADINASHVAFSVFDGDLKAGGDGSCSNDLYLTAIANFNKLKDPLIWLPGDNDWTDCWGRYGPSSAPFFDPLDRLNLERTLFASSPQSLGKKT